MYVVRAFVRLRQMLAGHAELSQKLAELEARRDSHDQEIAELMEAIRQLMAAPEASDRYIGFWSG